MNRIIKFRGLRKGDNTWLYGDLVHINGECHIFPEDAPNSPDYYEVIPESVGQFTGLEDSNNVEIYEGDIVRCSYFRAVLGESLGVSELDAQLEGSIAFNGLSLRVQQIKGLKWQEYTGYDEGEGECAFVHLHDTYEHSSDAEININVIGCIHQNPELLCQ